MMYLFSIKVQGVQERNSQTNTVNLLSDWTRVKKFLRPESLRFSFGIYRVVFVLYVKFYSSITLVLKVKDLKFERYYSLPSIYLKLNKSGLD